MSDISIRFRKALWTRFPGEFNDKGYVKNIRDNLVLGVDPDAVEEDLRQGDGNELGGKCRAIHSSSVLAANTFGWFKHRPELFRLQGFEPFKTVRLENKLPIFSNSRGTPPNLDAWFEGETSILAVESKLLEPWSPKAPAFADSYNKLEPSFTCPRWWSAYKSYKSAGKGHLDVAQLIKHGFGIEAYLKKHPSANVTLLYVYLEPLNWQDFPEFHEHRAELDRFQKTVAGGRFQFKWITYADLWNQWNSISELKLNDHLKTLQQRYLVSL